MRGDARRDFYAKTIALLGLGLLAGVGALVDYWPTHTPWPAVARLQSLPSSPATPPVPLATDVLVRHTRSSRVPAVVAGAAAGPAFSLHRAEPVSEFSAAPAPAVAALVERPRESAPAPDVTAPATNLGIEPGSAAAAQTPEGGTSVAPALIAAVDQAGDVSPVNTSESGLFSGAVRKTGVTIARTGAKTGASIFEAFRVIGGAVRRALPD